MLWVLWDDPFTQARDLLKKNTERAQKLVRGTRSRSSSLAQTICTRLPSHLWAFVDVCFFSHERLISSLRRSLLAFEQLAAAQARSFSNSEANTTVSLRVLQLA